MPFIPELAPVSYRVAGAKGGFRIIELIRHNQVALTWYTHADNAEINRFVEQYNNRLNLENPKNHRALELCNYFATHER